MKTIAQIIHKKKFPLRIFDSNGAKIYVEYSEGTWYKKNPDGTYTFSGFNTKIKSPSAIRDINWGLTDYINML